MNTFVMRAVFENEPPIDDRLEMESGLRGIVELLAPESQPEISSGQGSFWISVAAVGAPIAGWLAFQTASWALKRYVLDGPVAKTLEGKNGNSCGTEQEKMPRLGTDGETHAQLVPAPTARLNAVDERALQNFADFLRYGEPLRLTQITFKQLQTEVDSGTGVIGKGFRLTKNKAGDWSAEFIQMDTKEDFFAY